MHQQAVGMDVGEARKLRTLEEENAKLNRLLADAKRDNSALKGLVGKNGNARCQAECCRSSQTAFGMSERGVCQVLGCCWMTMHHQTMRVDDALCASV